VWEQIRANRIRSVWVVAGMGVLLTATGVALGVAFGGGNEGGVVVGGVVALVVWFFLWLTTISQGDRVMLRMARARRIQKKDHPQLWNVVEEMTIASTLGRMPAVYIVDDPSPNAFATGRKPENCAVAVTTGLLRTLNRDELQGVIAHEIGHIKNRDVALMVTAGVMVGAIALLAEIGIRALWWGGGARRSRSSNSSGNAQGVMMIVAVILIILAPILAQLVYFALSRRREYLADASGAMFTRYPEGLASALEKIGGVKSPQVDQSRVTAPMYIVRPLRKGEAMAARGSMSSTHPPIRERVKILRAMGGGADYAAYQDAYASVTGKKELMGGRTLAASERVAAVEGTGGPAVAPAVAAATALAHEPASETPAQRARQASDAFLAASGYHRVVCGGCDAILKIPAEVMPKVKGCPRCHASIDKAYPAP
jgi:heat shock protein HtpX